MLTISGREVVAAVKVQQHNDFLKALFDSTWGCDKETCQPPTRQLAAQYSATAALSGRRHLRTLTGAVSNWYTILR